MLTNLVVKQTYTGNGIQTVFPITAQIIRDTDGSDEIKVYLRNETVVPATQVLQTQITHYNLTGGTPPVNVTMVTAPPTGYKLIVARELSLTQVIDYLSTSQFPAETHELGLDAIVAMTQQLNESVKRAPRIPISHPVSDLLFPEPVATVVWGWDTDAQTIKYFTAAELTSIALGTILLRANNLSDLQSVPTALLNLGIDPFGVTANQSVDNNQAVAQNITNLLIAGASYTSAVIYYQVRRETATDSKIAIGRLFAFRQPHTGNWAMETGEWYGQDAINPGGLTFTLSQVGNDAQIKYTSDNLMGASYAGTIKTSVKYFKV
jgi:hypothetical protein